MKTRRTKLTFGGSNEIQNSKQRYWRIDRQQLSDLLGIRDSDQLSDYHRNWVEEILKIGSNQRKVQWTESIAVGEKEFVMDTKAKLSAKAAGRRGLKNNAGYELRETQIAYPHVLALKRVP